MKIKKSIIFFLTTAMLFVMLTACGRSTGSGTQSESRTTEAANTGEQSTQATATPEQFEECTLSVYGPATGLSLTDGIQTDDVSLQIRKDTGISIDLNAHPDDAKLNAMLASGDLPDVLCITDTSATKGTAILNQMIENSLLQPLDDLLKEYGKDILANAGNMVDFCREIYGADGKLYNLQGYIDPPPTKGFDGGIGPVIRFDYWAELGYPAINSSDDWLSVVSQMLKKHSTTDLGEKRYGFSPFFEWGWGAGIFHWGEICKGLEGEGIVTGRGGYMQYNLDTNAISNYITDTNSAMWTGVKFLNKANQMGLVDPDLFINKWDTVVQKTGADRILSSDWNWAYGDINIKLKDKGQGYALIPMKTTSFVSGTASPLGAAHRLWVIPEASGNPEAAMRFLNYLYSYNGARTISAGIKGEHYVEKNGKLQVPKTVMDAKNADSNWTANTGIGKYGNFMGLGPNVIDPQYGQKVNLSDPADKEVEDELNPFQKKYCEYFKIQRPSEIYSGLKISTFNGTITSIMEIAPDNIKEIDSNISDYLNVELQNLIIAKNDAEFESGVAKIIAACKEKGLDKSDAFWTKAWNDALAKVAKYE